MRRVSRSWVGAVLTALLVVGVACGGRSPSPSTDDDAASETTVRRSPIVESSDRRSASPAGVDAEPAESSTPPTRASAGAGEGGTSTQGTTGTGGSASGAPAATTTSTTRTTTTTTTNTTTADGYVTETRSGTVGCPHDRQTVTIGMSIEVPEGAVDVTPSTRGSCGAGFVEHDEVTRQGNTFMAEWEITNPGVVEGGALTEFTFEVRYRMR